MQSAKEAASNVAASAKAGMDKTNAVVQEKVDKKTAHDPIEKDMATQRKEEKITQAEINKQQARDENKAGVPGTYSHSATGTHGRSTGVHQMSAMPGHGTGQPLGGHVIEGTVGSHPIGKATGTGGTAAHHTQAGVNPGTHPTEYGTGAGGAYS